MVKLHQKGTKIDRQNGKEMICRVARVGAQPFNSATALVYNSGIFAQTVRLVVSESVFVRLRYKQCLGYLLCRCCCGPRLDFQISLSLSPSHSLSPSLSRVTHTRPDTIHNIFTDGFFYRCIFPTHNIPDTTLTRERRESDDGTAFGMPPFNFFSVDVTRRVQVECIRILMSHLYTLHIDFGSFPLLDAPHSLSNERNDTRARSVV